MLDNHGDLSIAVLIYYSVGILGALYVCHRQGWTQSAGWRFLVTLPIVRIVGAACTIAAEQKPSVGLYTAAAICNSIGLVPLILTLAAFASRINDGMPNKVPEPAFIAHHLATIVGLALAIAGGVESIPTNPASEISTGNTLRKAGGIILFVVFIVAVVFSFFLFTKKRTVWHGDRKLVNAAVVASPFILVRAIYFMLTAFDSKSKTFNIQSPNIYVQAFMQILMEFVTFAIFLVAGLTSPSIKDGRYEEKMGYAKTRGGSPAQLVDAELGTIPARH